MANEIQTPAEAQKVSDFTETQIASLKAGFKIWGNDLLSAVKTGINHKLGVNLYEDSLFSVVSDGSILSGDTIEDLEGNVFTVSFIKTKYIPAYCRSEFYTDGAIAYVNLSIPDSVLKGIYTSQFGSTGTGDGEFQEPAGIAVADNYIYVSDSSNDNIQIFDLNGAFISKFGSNGSGDREFLAPYNIAVNDSNIFVADHGRRDVQIFDLNGAFVSKFGATGTGDGEFQSPIGIAISDDNLYIADSSRVDIQIFDLNGAFVSKFGATGTGDGEFDDLSGINIHGDKLYAVDYGRFDVQIFDLDGNFETKFGREGTGDGEFQSPRKVFATDTNIFVVDKDAASLSYAAIDIFDLNGVFLSKFGSFGYGNSQFISPASLFVTDDNIYALDYNKDYVKIFK